MTFSKSFIGSLFVVALLSVPFMSVQAAPMPSVSKNDLVPSKTISAGKGIVIGSFTVTTGTQLSARNSTFQIGATVPNIQKYLTNVRVISSMGVEYNGTLTKDGSVAIPQRVNLSKGTHHFYILADVSKTIPQNAKFNVVLKNSFVTYGKLSLPVLIPEGETLKLQTMRVR